MSRVGGMNDLIEKAKELRREIKRQEREIDNPALVTGILNELEFFIENVASEEE